ncbi:hypothetical protein L1887_40775 [Cichorium endivia]|nr:hypothetical protein L1887_40775 [Cichorium endivia]
MEFSASVTCRRRQLEFGRWFGVGRVQEAVHGVCEAGFESTQEEKNQRWFLGLTGRIQGMFLGRVREIAC